MQLNETAAFVSVIEHGGYAAAGRASNVPRSTLSRQVKRLEERLGVRLLQRTTRRLGLTDAGKDYYDQCRAAMEAIELAEKRAIDGSDRPSGTLRITSVNLSTLEWMMDGVAEFRRRYPEIALVFDFNHRRTDLIEEGFDVALRGGRMTGGEVVARLLAPTSVLLYASPRYLERRGTPRGLADLGDHDGVLVSPIATRGPLRLEGPDGVVEARLPAAVVANDMAFARGLVLRGMGIGLLENGLAAPHLSDGTLVQVLPEYGIHTGGGFFVVYPSRLHVAARVRVFVDFMIAHCNAHHPVRASG